MQGHNTAKNKKQICGRCVTLERPPKMAIVLPSRGNTLNKSPRKAPKNGDRSPFTGKHTEQKNGRRSPLHAIAIRKALKRSKNWRSFPLHGETNRIKLAIVSPSRDSYQEVGRKETVTNKSKRTYEHCMAIKRPNTKHPT